MAAVREHGRALQFAHELVNKGGDDAKAVVMAAVRKDGMALRYAGPFKEDPEVVMAAVREDGVALRYAGPFKEDRKGGSDTGRWHGP